jgi:hypothetical protein
MGSTDFWLSGREAARLGELLAHKPRAARKFGETLIAFGILAVLEKS